MIRLRIRSDKTKWIIARAVIETWVTDKCRSSLEKALVLSAASAVKLDA